MVWFWSCNCNFLNSSFVVLLISLMITWWQMMSIFIFFSAWQFQIKANQSEVFMNRLMAFITSRLHKQTLSLLVSSNVCFLLFFAKHGVKKQIQFWYASKPLFKFSCIFLNQPTFLVSQLAMLGLKLIFSKCCQAAILHGQLEIEIWTKVLNFEWYHPYRVVRTGLPVDRYADRLLLGRTLDIALYRMIQDCIR